LSHNSTANVITHEQTLARNVASELFYEHIFTVNVSIRKTAKERTDHPF